MDVGRINALEMRFERLDTDVLEHMRDIHRHIRAYFAKIDASMGKFEQRLSGVEGRLSGVEGRLSGVERQLTGIREQMADNQRVLLAKMNVFIKTQGGINRRVDRRLRAVASKSRRRRSSAPNQTRH